MDRAALRALEPPQLEDLPPLCSMHVRRLRSQQTELGSYLRKGVGAGFTSSALTGSAAKRPAEAVGLGGGTSSKRRRGQGGIKAFFTRPPAAAAAAAGGDHCEFTVAAADGGGVTNGLFGQDEALEEAIRLSLLMDESVDGSAELAAGSGNLDAGAQLTQTAAAAGGAAGAAGAGGDACGGTGGGRLGEVWGGLFRGAAAKSSARAPFCHHKERAVSYETKNKRSENFGKRIWMCDHSKHPQGDWHSNPYPDNEARCPFFEWDKQFRGFVAKCS